jgi:CAAX prenyl protease-like protein
LLRWLLLAALLIGEVLLLTLRFDAGTLPEQSGWWADLLRDSHLLLQLVIATAAATLLLGGAVLWDEVRQLPAPLLSLRTSGILFLGHLTVLALFTGVTTLLLEGDAVVLPKPAWTILWLVLGLTVAGSWALLALPVRLWLLFLRRNGLILLAGFGIGVLTVSAGLLLQRCWLPLAEATLWIVRALLGLIYTEVVCQPDERIIGTAAFTVEIAPQCSGYEGVGLLSVFVAVYLWLFRHDLRFPHALLLWPAGVVVLWLANALRITALIVLGTGGWPEVALGGFHSQAGWLVFNAVALGLAVLARRLRFFAVPSVRESVSDNSELRTQNCELADQTVGHAPRVPEKEQAARLPYGLVRPFLERRTQGPHPTTAYLMPFLAILAATMLTSAFTAGFDALYPLRVLAATAVLWRCRRAYTELHWSWSWQPFVLGTAVFVLWIALVPSGIGAPSPLRDGLVHLSSAWAAVWLIFRIVGAVITVPLAEELVFRGYLPRRLQSADWRQLPPGQFTWMSLLVSSILFGVMHGAWLAGTLAGLAYAFAVSRRGKLLDAVLAHATTNALLAGYVLATGAWALWS